MKDRNYGGVFLTRAGALDGLKFGCPPTEILVPYFRGEPAGYISGARIDAVRERLESHFNVCERCRALLGALAEDTSFNKAPV